MAVDRKHIHVSLKFLVSGFNVFSGEREAEEVWAFNEADARYVASKTLSHIDLVRRVSEGHIASIYPVDQYKIDVDAFWSKK